MNKNFRVMTYLIIGLIALGFLFFVEVFYNEYNLNSLYCEKDADCVLQIDCDNCSCPPIVIGINYSDRQARYKTCPLESGKVEE